MRVKLFTFRYSATLGGFDETPLTSFLKDKEVLAFREHFFHVNDTPHLVCVVTWQDAVVGEAELETARALRAKTRDDENHTSTGTTERRRTRSRGAAPDPTAGLDERERALFNSLREWRAAKAQEEGVPPYLVFTNRHLVSLVTSRPDSPTALANLPGIGPGKVKRYGQEVLALVGAAPAASAEPHEPAEPPPPPPPAKEKTTRKKATRKPTRSSAQPEEVSP